MRDGIVHDRNVKMVKHIQGIALQKHAVTYRHITNFSAPQVLKLVMTKVLQLKNGYHDHTCFANVL